MKTLLPILFLLAAVHASGQGYCVFPGAPPFPLAPLPGVIISLESLATGLPTPLAPYALARINGFVFSYDGHPVITASSLPLPETMGGTQVLINGTAAPLLKMGLDLSRLPPVDYLIFQVPGGIPVGEQVSIQLRMTPPDGSSCVSGDLVANSVLLAPGLFQVQGDSFFNAQTGSAITQTQPANVDDYVTAYGTGFGATHPAIKTGDSTNQPATLLVPIEVTVDRVPTDVIYAGAAPMLAGVYQINFRVPHGLLPGAHSVAVRVKGASSRAASPNAVTTQVSGFYTR